MATNLDRSFVRASMDNVRALANEVERLECLCAAYEAKLSPEEIKAASDEASKNWCAMPRIILE